MKAKLSTIIILAGIYCSSILTSCTPNNPQPNTNPSSTSSNLWVAATSFPYATGKFDTGSGFTLTKITSMVTYNNELIVAGDFKAIGGIVAHSIAKWNGVNWSNIGIGNFLNSKIEDMVVYNNKLYFTADKLYVWDGSVLNEFYYSNPNTSNTYINGTDLHVFNGKLYLLSSSGTYIYDGTNVTTLNNPLSTPSKCLGNLNNTLYCGTYDGLYKYENNVWTNVNGITTSSPNIINIATYNNELYALGEFNSIGVNRQHKVDR